MLNRLITKLDKHLTNLENRDFSPFYWFTGLISIIVTRNILEGLLEEKHVIGLHETLTISLIDFFLQNTLFFLALFLSLAIVFHLLTKLPINRVSKPLLYYYTIILSVPFIDFFISRGSGYYLGYPVTIETAGQVIIHFFNPEISLSGISFGLRIEVLLACIAGAMYVYRCTTSILRTIIAPFIIYFIVILTGFYPFISGVFIKIVFQIPGSFATLNSNLKDIFFMGEALPYVGLRLSLMWLFWISYLLLLYFYFYDREQFSKFIHSFWVKYAFQFPFMVGFGILLSSICITTSAKYFFSHPFGVLATIGLLMSSILLGRFYSYLKISGILSLKKKEDNAEINIYNISSFAELVLFIIMICFVIIIYLPSIILLFSLFALAILLFTVPFNLYRFMFIKISIETTINIILILIGSYLLSGVRLLTILSPRVIFMLFLLTFSLSILNEISNKKFTFATVMFLTIAGGTNFLSFVPIGGLKHIIYPLLSIIIMSFFLFFSHKNKFILSWSLILLLWITPLGLLAKDAHHWQNYSEKFVKQDKLTLARMNFDKGRYYQAIEQFRQIEELNSSSEPSSFSIELGISYLKVKDYQNALVAFDKYLEHNPFSKDALVGEAISFEKLGYLPKSLEIYQSMVKNNIAGPRVFLMYGVALFKTGHYKEALNQYEHIKILDKSLPQIWVHIGDALAAMEKYPEAEKAFKHTLSLSIKPSLKKLVMKRLQLLHKKRYN